MKTFDQEIKSLWIGMNKKSINGRYQIKKKGGAVPMYIQLGTQLRLTYDELVTWCYQNWKEIQNMIDAGLRPSIGLRDKTGHYDIKNIIIVDAKKEYLKSKQNAVEGIHVGTGQEVFFESLAAAERYGFKASLIHQVLIGARKTHGGYKWKAVTERIK